jgi:glycosyltransferase involved in cell wall biosynthesis
MKVAITTPIKNDAYILPYFLGCLLEIDFPREDLHLCFIDDASTDGTTEILKTFKRKHGKRFGRVTIQYRKEAFAPAATDRHFGNQAAGFAHLADLRNALLDLARASGADYQLSIDADTLVAPSLLTDLLQFKKPYLAPLVITQCRHPQRYPLTAQEHLNHRGNAFQWEAHWWHHVRRYALETLYPVAVATGCYLIDRATMESGVRYAPSPHGEDVAYCLALEAAGIPRYWWTGVRTVHCKEPETLNARLETFSTLFGYDAFFRMIAHLDLS